MDLVLLPSAEGTNLKELYHRALRNSEELYIVSAYLTNWDIEESLGDQCKSFLFIVGKDFGITRKTACERVIKWLPKSRHAHFLAAESVEGFHPKAMFWRESDGRCYALVGSSNLSKAAFSTNHEVNGYSQITEDVFDEAKIWISHLERSCVVIDETWLAKYREAVQPKRPANSGREKDDYVFDLRLPSTKGLNGLENVLSYRRKQIRLFKQGRPALERLFRDCALVTSWGNERNLEFYVDLHKHWFFGDDGYRFQGAGWERKGKGSNFNELSKSLVRVLDADEAARDQVVVSEIDHLANLKIATRKALFSEMLCQFFPKRYYVVDKPVSDWLDTTNTSAPRGSSEGVRYIHAARLLRAALDRSKDYPAKSLAELDAVIWLAMNQDKY